MIWTREISAVLETVIWFLHGNANSTERFGSANDLHMSQSRQYIVQLMTIRFFKHLAELVFVLSYSLSLFSDTFKSQY